MVDVNDWDRSPPGCARAMCLFLSDGVEPAATSFIVFALSRCSRDMSLKPLRHVLTHLEVPFNQSESLNQLRNRLRIYVSCLQKSRSDLGVDHSWKSLFSDLVNTQENWPQVVSSTAKERICSHFLELTGMTALKSGVCASCAESCLDRSLQLINAASLNLDILRCPDLFQNDDPSLYPWLDPEVTSPSFPLSLRGVLVDQAGVSG